MIYSIQGLEGASEFETLSAKIYQAKKAKTTDGRRSAAFRDFDAP